MRETRYYQMKADGIFFSRLPKDADPNVKDGREFRQWTFGNDTGQTLGYIDKTISGVIESAYIQDFESGDRFFCVGLQHQDGVDVFQCELMGKYGMNNAAEAWALRWGNIDLDLPVQLSVYIGKPNKNGFKPAYLNINQAGRPVWPTFDRKKEGFGYEGVPDLVKTEKMGKVTYNSDEKDEFLYGQLKEFMAKVEASGKKESRSATPAESAVGSSNTEDDSEDVPF